MAIRLRIYPQYGMNSGYNGFNSYGGYGSFGLYGRRRRGYGLGQALRHERQTNRLRLQYERALWSQRMQAAQLQAQMGAVRYATPYATPYAAVPYAYTTPYATGMYAQTFSSPYGAYSAYGIGGAGLGYSSLRGY